ncbi:MAG TPA: AAA domain-containing protein, partial [Actinomycetota bacterium]|nr:AAA domain-containing protein [Actinomycetota bacterium]
RPEHRIQIAFYAMLLRRMAEEAGVPLSELTGSVWRIPAGPEDEQPTPFPLEPYEEAVRLLLDDRGVVSRIARARREEARFHLTYKCDGCVYNALCMREAAETDSLALVPFMSLRDRSVLEREGVRDLRLLARLEELPPDGRGPLRPARGRRGVLERLEAEWPLCANLDLHVQRARQVARARGDRDIEALGWIIGSGFGSLPDPDEHPGLVQVFVDAQHDYLQDALYLAAALVVGPDGGTEEVIELAEEPPDPEAEGELLVRWVTRLLDAVRRVAGEETLLHVYVYDRYDQKVLLDALRRHLDRLSAMPDFFDLLTETPALSQSMFSFLADEVRDRKNLGILCHSLPMVARRLGFDWDFEGVAYHRRFQARVFDNRRTLPDGRWYESAARFNSQIPLEYAYGAWGALPEPGSPEDRPLIEPFRVTRNELLGFARARLHALWYVERSFRYKNRYLRKEPVRVPGRRRAHREVRLADVLVEFLHVEHHAKLQACLLHYAQPVERRVASGRSILVEALEDASEGRCRFRFRFEEAGLDPAVALAQMDPKEGDWMVLGEPARIRPWDILRGRVVVIREIGERGLVADLTRMSFPRERFRFPHDRGLAVSRGGRYVLDPMADDLVAHRLLDACEHADDNVLLRWIEAGGGAVGRRRVRREEREAVESFARALDEARTILTPTLRQTEVIARRLGDRIFLVQGPPGTGKTHTIAWAVLARAFAAALAGRPFRVLVCSMTHTAIEVLLRSLVGKLEALRGDRGTRQLAHALDALAVFKEVSNDDAVPDGVRAIRGSDARRALAEPLAVIGAVPAGVHRLLRGLADPVDWADKRFDLVVIDEASQVSLPAAVLAGAALREDGQALIVGDHRQMPPILVHDWEREPRRAAQDSQVYRSTFESLLARGFPAVGLDRSFRLHAMHAEFLENHVYREDGVGFHSE